ncbi:MAG TPA: hypothetical protein VEP90_15520 [Methylomirabilota bacterium]|nr:hypothetical protein [Candidatus Acidoferrum sp.]HYT43748.1 hypothetical protein [Methylomirabilota bacterium]
MKIDFTPTIKDALEQALNKISKQNKTVNYYPIAHWPHPWPPAGGFRHLIFNAKKNGFDKVIKRVGRRILIDEAAFFEWVKNR